MTSARVKQVLRTIAGLSQDEQCELLKGLPQVLHAAANSAPLSENAVRQAIETREHIGNRLAHARESPGSIAADLEEVREGRLADLIGDGAPPAQPL